MNALFFIPDSYIDEVLIWEVPHINGLKSSDFMKFIFKIHKAKSISKSIIHVILQTVLVWQASVQTFYPKAC